ncbi:DUF11 domain-containing protein [Candidatus Saccharibacteria bacterium]|nr:DUF11 domain-containing protein [Candidatus Saccharibacteria bacterium]
MKKIAKAGLGAATVAAVVATGAFVAFAWGPTRTTYTMAHPADHIVFNSITDNKTEVGDERYFVSASPYTGNSNNNYWSDATEVENGKEYVVRMYVHNNAGANLGLVAQDVHAYAVLPTDTASQITVSGKVSYKDQNGLNPAAVWDETTFKSKNGEKFNLAYVDGSAKYYNTKDGKLRTFNLDGNSLLTNKGAMLGYDQMDGKIPGCGAYSGYVTFHVKAQFAEKPNLAISKEVKLLGSDNWSESVNAKAGDTVRYRIHVTNTGNATLKNVIVRDILPTGLTYVKGSTTIVNPAHPKGVALSDNLTTDAGINIGDYAAAAGAWIYFNATVNKSVSDKCENTLLRNVAQANAGTESGQNTGTKEDPADVTVDGKKCTEGFKIDKMVQLDGETEWHETVKAEGGQKIHYRIRFTNTGNTTLNNVVITDTLPAHLTYIKGSSKLDDKALADGVISKEGINIGSVAAGKTVALYFDVLVDESLKGSCEDSTLTNVVKGKYNNDDKTSKTDTAIVTVDGKDCSDKKNPGFTIDKKVQIKGDKDWSETVKATAGQTIRYRIQFKNTGNTTLNNIVITDTLPAHLTYVKGSTMLDDKALADGVISKEGINIGSVAAGKTVNLYFYVTVDKALADSCEDSKLTNVVKGKYNNDDKTSKTDTAIVTVDGKDCREEDNPGFKIDKMVQLDGGKEWSETVNAAAGSKVRYRIQFKNTGNTTLKNVVIRDLLPKGMTYVKGTTILYNAANADGKTLADGIVSEDGINIGNYAKGTEATIYFYATVNAAMKDNCQNSTLTNTVKGQYNGDDKTTQTDTADVAVPGKTCGNTPVTPGKKVTPGTPSELPKTGPVEVISGIAGLASVATAASYYIVSRKKLN